ncbi:hypothetical protein [Hydrogenimonas sp.]
MITSSLQNEFWFHVSPQENMPIAGNVEQFIDIARLRHLINQLDLHNNVTGQDIRNIIENDPEMIDILRSLVGISDKRMYLDLSYIFYKTRDHRNPNLNILGQDLYNVNTHPLTFFKKKIYDPDPYIASAASSLIVQYLVNHGICQVLDSLKIIGAAQATVLIDRLINAKEAQQKLTKRRGHGMEQRFAIFLQELGIPFLPEDRAENPMSRDPNVLKSTFELSPKITNRTWAFDLIIQDYQLESIAFVQSLIHTSDPGQYGVNKSDETVTIKRELEEYNNQYGYNKELWGIVDGVGFAENKKGTIDKMLDEFDTFIQLNSIYKAGLKLHKLGLIKIKDIVFNNNIYTHNEATAMFQKYGSPDINFYHGVVPPNTPNCIRGGYADIII